MTRRAACRPGPVAAHPAAVGALLAAAVIAVAVPLTAHFRGNAAVTLAVAGGFAALLLLLEACARAGHRRRTGTFSYSPAREERALRRREG